MPIHAATVPETKPAPCMHRLLGGLAILLVLCDAAIKLVPWPLVADMMDRMSYGSSETLARGFGTISVVCTLLYSFPPTSFVGAILLTGHLGAVASQVRIGSLLFAHMPIGVYLVLVLCGGLWLRDRVWHRILPSAR
jgi:hypothetical protein